MYVLSGDIGGTNTRLEVSFLENSITESVAVRKYKGANWTFER